ncbi:hypothetical protein [Tissierella carlieri]
MIKIKTLIENQTQSLPRSIFGGFSNITFGIHFIPSIVKDSLMI